MANPNPNEESYPFSFSDFPEDVQLCILSFLSPLEISTFACTSKRFIKKWGNGKITYRQPYNTLAEYDNLIGFWRRSGQVKKVNSPPPPPLVFFEWGPSFVTGSRVSPAKTGTYKVVKAPFLCLSVMADGNPVSFLDPECRFELSDDFVEFGELENVLVPVNVSFMGKGHVVVEENLSFVYSNSPEGRKIGIRRVSSSGNLSGEEYGVVEDARVGFWGAYRTG
ncbi:F-box family protein [Actinidia rufa]|uniref:F-box family protein n=1 Tax=Actinidia rufa TaxID=165716 RepID=A0A7J0FBF6_9ERIC|nr:F-box family protein [Actinidia rufa]